MRAVTIDVSERTSVAGLIFPGDRTDILLLQQMPGAPDPESSTTGNYAPRTAETFLENVRILATERTLNDIEGEAKKISTVTVEVTPKQAEMLAAIRDLGDLSLSLRSLAKQQNGVSGPQVASTETSTPVTGIAFLNETAASTPTSTAPAAAETTPASEDEMPVLGTTSTLDVEVSRPLASRVLGKGSGIQVIHGSTSGVAIETVHVD
jgi:Flp pilus assembly protein CpaB